MKEGYGDSEAALEVQKGYLGIRGLPEDTIYLGYCKAMGKTLSKWDC